MYNKGDVIDNKYIVTNLCSDKGGMGTIVFVSPIGTHVPYPLVLKYCKSTNSELIQRFIREVRNLATFKGNSKVMQIYAYNIGCQPPYFVMQYFSDGDLTTLCKALKNDASLQEKIFHGMIDCVNELHTKGLQHRDIKPQNFLRNGDQIIISDLGLSKEIGAGTTFTMSREFWGTQGYLPPEFVTDGFKECDSTSDIFMLGKSFYYLLTERDPLYITSNDIHPAVYHVINKCCETEKGRRYRTLSDLKQGLTLSYDVILSRANGGGKARQLLRRFLIDSHRKMSTSLKRYRNS